MIASFRLVSPLILAPLLSAALSACIIVPIPVGVYYPEDSQPTRPWPATATCPTPARTAQDGAALVALMNGARAQAGLGPLTLDPGVSAVAQHYACENAARQSLDHVGSDGATLLERFRRGGLKPSLAAENTGIGYASVASAFAGWMASPHHRDNILRREVTRVGLGEANGTPRQTWVVDFMAPR